MIKRVAADMQRTLRRRSILNLQIISSDAVLAGDKTSDTSEIMSDALDADDSSR